MKKKTCLIIYNPRSGKGKVKEKIDKAIECFSQVSEALLELAQNEKAIELISAEIEKTRRRVNAIENVTIPNYIDTIKYIQLKLSEDERASTSRLMKIKEMLLKK